MPKAQCNVKASAFKLFLEIEVEAKIREKDENHVTLKLDWLDSRRYR